MTRPSKNRWAMDLALTTAKRATCLRRQVGCILLNVRGHVLATGYNGVASGMPHCNQQTGALSAATIIDAFDRVPVYHHACDGANAPSGQRLDDCEAIHAEQNALLQCRNVHEIYSCYVTVSPCITCTKLLMNTGCRKIVFNEAYVSSARLLWTKRGGRQWLHINELEDSDD